MCAALFSRILYSSPSSPLPYSHRRKQNPLRRRTVDVQRDFPHRVLQPVRSLREARQHVHDLLLLQREAVLRGRRLRHELLVLLDERDDRAADIAANALDELVRAVFERFLDETQAVLVDERHGGNGASEEAVQRAVAKGGVAEGEIRSGRMEIERRDLLAENEERFDPEKLAVHQGLPRKNGSGGSRNGDENGADGFGGEIGHNGVLDDQKKGQSGTSTHV